MLPYVWLKKPKSTLATYPTPKPLSSLQRDLYITVLGNLHGSGTMADTQRVFLLETKLAETVTDLANSKKTIEGFATQLQEYLVKMQKQDENLNSRIEDTSTALMASSATTRANNQVIETKLTKVAGKVQSGPNAERCDGTGNPGCPNKFG